MRKSMFYPAILSSVVLVAVGCGSKGDEDLGSNAGKVQQASGGPAGAQGTAVLSGKATLKGKAPAAAKIDMGADPLCKAQHSGTVKDESVIQNADGTLRNVFVYVKSGAGNYPAPAAPVVLEQKGCMYDPHVVGVQVGQTLEIVNSDATMHNVHCMAEANEPFNLAQASQGAKADKVFAKPEVMVKFKCDVHSWMHAYVGAVNNPFFGVTGADGSFKITGLPAGTYTLEAWHEKYGTSDQTITLKDGESQTVNFTFSPN